MKLQSNQLKLVHYQVLDHVIFQVHDRVHDRVCDRVRDQVRGEICGRVSDGRVSDRIWKVRDHITSQVREFREKVKNTLTVLSY